EISVQVFNQINRRAGWRLDKAGARVARVAPSAKPLLAQPARGPADVSASLAGREAALFPTMSRHNHVKHLVTGRARSCLELCRQVRATGGRKTLTVRLCVGRA